MSTACQPAMAAPGCVFRPPTCEDMKAFKVDGGKIHAAETILEVLPIGAPSGW
jgi:hypothetical protein